MSRLNGGLGVLSEVDPDHGLVSDSKKAEHVGSGPQVSAQCGHDPHETVTILGV